MKGAVRSVSKTIQAVEKRPRRSFQTALALAWPPVLSCKSRRLQHRDGQEGAHLLLTTPQRFSGGSGPQRQFLPPSGPGPGPVIRERFGEGPLRRDGSPQRRPAGLLPLAAGHVLRGDRKSVV